MWLDVDYQFVANIALLAAAAVESIFTGLYFVRSNWRANRIGRIFMVKCVALAAVLIQAAVSSWWPGTDYPFRHQIRFAIYTVGALAYVSMTVALWREQQLDRDRAREEFSLPPGVPPL
ncbi:hypothetical protein H7J73_32055 [Mycolicibacterium komossense]|uniref:Uncharacterized protein n=1 Tax=Mycolicibacterium komossense TaxID=1779 RepID=A0ABT3CMM9_9MYCO|nr:hypothetical protein [Mycolicibacterium komossense]